MAQIPLVPKNPAILAEIPSYVRGDAQQFADDVEEHQDTLEIRDGLIQAAVEYLTAAIGYGALTGGAITSGMGLSVNVGAYTAIVGNWVGNDASQVVGGLTDGALNYLWLRQDGQWTVNTTGITPLSTDGHGAAMLWGTATVVSGAVTIVSNIRRSFLQNLAVFPLLTADPPGAVNGDAWVRVDLGELKIAGGPTLSAGGGGGGTGLNPRGDYNPTVTYAIDDVVQSAGSSYYAIAPTLGHAPPNASYWSLLAAIGPAGGTGPAGPAGPAGAQGYTERGAWSAVTAYVPYDVVFRGRNRYVAIASGTNQDPLTPSSAYWGIFVQGGADGAPGTAGINGADGATWYLETTLPDNSIGADGDVWLYMPTGDGYKKISGVYVLRGSLAGPPGSRGLQGPPGNDGASLGTPIITTNFQTGTTYTLVLTDAGKRVKQTNAGACTLTVPPNSAVAFAIGTTIEVSQGGAGAVTITAGAGVTIHSRGGLVVTNGQYALVRLYKEATDTWELTGDRA